MAALWTAAAARCCLSAPSIFSNRCRSDTFCSRHLRCVFNNSSWITCVNRPTNKLHSITTTPQIRGVARIFGLGGQTVPCRAEPDPASTEVIKKSLKKLCPLCAGGALAPPASPPLATPLQIVSAKHLSNKTFSLF